MNIKDAKQWLVWRIKSEPTSALTNSRQRWQENLATYTEAHQFCVDNPEYSLGFCFSPDTDFIGLDIDGCRNPATGEIEAWGREILERLPEGCITNVSVSGTGVKVILRCESDIKRHVRHYEDVVAHGGHTPQCELFVKSKYFAITAKEIDETVLTAIDLPTLQLIVGAELEQQQRTEVASGGDVPIERIRAALDFLDVTEFDARDRWFAILQGVHHGCGGSDEGYEAFREWSEGDEAQFNEEQLQLDWDSQDADKVGGVTFGTVMHQLTPEQIATIVPSRTAQFSPIEVADPQQQGMLPMLLQQGSRCDVVMADLFVAETGGTIRYVSERKQWLLWTGDRWERSKCESGINQKLQQWARTLAGRVPNGGNEDVVARAYTYCVNLCNATPISNLRRVVMSHPDVLTKEETMDTKNDLFNCANGTLDLKTFELREHRKEDLITQITDTNYVEDGKCPNWDSTMQKVFCGNQDLIDYFQRVMGYALIGSTKEEIMLILYGNGSNGKSTVTQTLNRVLGTKRNGGYSNSVTSKLLDANRQLHDQYQAQLDKCRLALFSELESDVQLAESVLKNLTSQDDIDARYLHENSFTFTPTHLAILSTNHKPEVKNNDNGIWRRIKLIPFEANLAKLGKDVDMPEKLKAEYGGILSWCVEGLKAYREHGLGKCEVVEAATRQYRTDEDSFEDVFNSVFTKDSGSAVNVTDAYAAYSEAGGAMNKKAFSKEMERRGHEKATRKISGKNSRCYVGINLSKEVRGL